MALPSFHSVCDDTGQHFSLPYFIVPMRNIHIGFQFQSQWFLVLSSNIFSVLMNAIWFVLLQKRNRTGHNIQFKWIVIIWTFNSNFSSSICSIVLFCLIRSLSIPFSFHLFSFHDRSSFTIHFHIFNFTDFIVIHFQWMIFYPILCDYEIGETLMQEIHCAKQKRFFNFRNWIN